MDTKEYKQGSDQFFIVPVCYCRPSGPRKARIRHSVWRLVVAKDITKESPGPSKKFMLLELASELGYEEQEK